MHGRDVRPPLKIAGGPDWYKSVTEYWYIIHTLVTYSKCFIIISQINKMPEGVNGAINGVRVCGYYWLESKGGSDLLIEASHTKSHICGMTSKTVSYIIKNIQTFWYKTLRCIVLYVIVTALRHSNNAETKIQTYRSTIRALCILFQISVYSWTTLLRLAL